MADGVRNRFQRCSWSKKTRLNTKRVCEGGNYSSVRSSAPREVFESEVLQYEMLPCLKTEPEGDK